MHALEWSRVGWLLPLAVAGALLARCGEEPSKLRKQVTVASEAATFWLELDAHAGRVIVGDPFATCGDPTRKCRGQVRILRQAGAALVEEARFYGTEESLGESVTIHGDRAAALQGKQVVIYERETAGWRVATTMWVADCHEYFPVEHIELDSDTLVLHTYEAICIAERKTQWAMTKLAATRFSSSEPVIQGDTLAFTEDAGDTISIYRRGRAGWRNAETITTDRPHALALSEHGVLAVESEGSVVLFDITDKPRRIAALQPQSSAGEYWGAELTLDRDTLAVWNDDGVHVYRRHGKTWRADGLVRPVLPETRWFGSRLVLDGDWLWIGDPDMSDSERFPSGGFVHGFR
jgi:hypothetical protein